MRHMYVTIALELAPDLQHQECKRTPLRDAMKVVLRLLTRLEKAGL